jgi:hypothetical protein
MPNSLSWVGLTEFKRSSIVEDLLQNLPTTFGLVSRSSLGDWFEHPENVTNPQLTYLTPANHWKDMISQQQTPAPIGILSD